jgi:RNA polymerase sigma factor (TIGR02999 family)
MLTAITYQGEPMSTDQDITGLLDDWTRGDRGALDRLLPVIYAELRRIAIRQLRHERNGHTLQPTALVHEAYMRLVDQRSVGWHDRAHFFGVAAQVMRRVLVDHARRQSAKKRGYRAQQVPLEDIVAPPPDPVPVLALDHALSRLQQLDPGLAHIVELRAFGGLTIEEAAHVMNVSASTAKRGWRTARAWLIRELAPGEPS